MMWNNGERGNSMKFLFIDLCSRSINPTNSLILALLRLVADVVCYGPGFVDEADLKGGIAKFAERHGPFDFHVMTLISFELRESEVRFHSRFTYPRYSYEIVKAFAADAAVFLKQDNVPKILFLTALDPYALPEEYARIIAELNGYVVSWAEGFSKPISELDLNVFSREKFFARYKHRGFGRWHDVVTKYGYKFINLSHFVAETEFIWTSLDNRENKAVVPGMMYVRREAARRKLAERRILARTGKFGFLMSVMDHAGLRPYSRPLLQLLYNQTFVKKIGSVRYAYTEGSGFDYPIRKYFEIAAFGTILLCTPCAGFENLGFVDRMNAIVVDPDAIGDAVEWLQSSPARAQEIASAGRNLIWNRHSLHARGEQFARCLKSIAAGRFLGSGWDNGEFVVDEGLRAFGSTTGGNN
jgi:glycosyltransferase involved in cell wall biosynthesis